MPEFVLDASMTLAWCFEDESTPFTDSVHDQLRSGSECLVPAIWPSEVANGVRMAERRGRITTTRASDFLSMLLTLPISVIDPSSERTFLAVLDLARDEQLTVYDAQYLDLAMRENLPLASLDNRLCTAAGNVGVPLVDHARP